MRHTFFIVLCLGALLFPALALTDTGSLHSTGPGGLVQPQVDGRRVGAWTSPRPSLKGSNRSGAYGFAPTAADNLTYAGPDQSGDGPVMRTNTVYAIYWVPPGFSQAPNYQSVVNGYFANVAADSGASTNAYAAATQYSDTTGPIAYDSTFGGSSVDKQPFPKSGCANPPSVLGATVCLTDDQIQAEI